MPRGGFGGGFGRGFGRGFGGFGMRRFGRPLLMPGMGWGMGGYGSPLMTTLLAGGVGYALGSSSASQPQMPVQGMVQPYPPYAYPPPASMTPNRSGVLAQLQLLGQLRDSGTLSAEEFEREKQRILGQP